MVKCVEDVGVGFMFVLRYYLVMKVVVFVCKVFKIKIVFNIFGLMLNFVCVLYFIVGVYYDNLVSFMVF